MGRLRGRGLGGLCSSAQGAPTWASTAHGGHSRDGPTVAVYGGTDTGVTQQPHVGAQAELSRAPRRGLSAADSEVWVGTVCVPQGGPVHCHTHTAPRSPAPRPLCRERDFAPTHSPASRWWVPAAPFCPQPHWLPPVSPRGCHHQLAAFWGCRCSLHGAGMGPMAPSGGTANPLPASHCTLSQGGPLWFVTAPHISAAGGHLCPVCASSALPTAVAPHSTEGPSSAFPAPCREQHEGIWGQQRPWAAGGALGRL